MISRYVSVPSWWGLAVVAALPLCTPAGAAAGSLGPPVMQAGRAPVSLARVPLSFEPNVGQAPQGTSFLSHGQGYTLLLSGIEADLALRGPANVDHSRRRGIHSLMSEPAAEKTALVRMKLVGAASHSAGEADAPEKGVSNYFIGKNQSRWRTAVPNYGRVRFHNVYPGIDLVYYGNQQRLEHDFVVQPGANPDQVQLRFTGVKGLPMVDAAGNLQLKTDGGEVTLQKPVIYQEKLGHRTLVEGGYRVEQGTVGLRLGAYDRRSTLVVDPVLLYSTFLGGSDNDLGYGIAVDGAGDIFVTGGTYSGDAFVTKLNAAGSLAYSTYLGGGGFDEATGIAVDPAGDACVTGLTYSSEFFAEVGFPTTPRAFQTSGPTRDVVGFVTKLSPDGASLLYSTYLGPSDTIGWAIAVDGQGSLCVTGYTTNGDGEFPTTKWAFQTTYYSNADRVFVAKISPAGRGSADLLYSTYLDSPSGGYYPEDAYGIAVDGAGHIYVTGTTWSPNFPTTPGAIQTTLVRNDQEVFMAKLNPGSQCSADLLYSTYLDGYQAHGIAVDTLGNAYVVGSTRDSNFPVTPNAAQPTFGGGYGHAFIVKLHPDRPPVANAGAPFALPALHTGNPASDYARFTLDGSQSSDPDGDALSYQWTDGQGNPLGGSTAMLSLNHPVGIYNFYLTVTDPTGLSSDPAMTTVQVLPAPNQPPAANPGNSQSVEYQGPLTSVNLDGSASSDPDGDAITYRWSENGTLLAAGARPTVKLSPGSHTITLTVTDTYGATGTAAVKVTVYYAWSNLLQPINVDGSSVFKQGSTIPLKFKLIGASASLTNLTPKLWYAQVSNGIAGNMLAAGSTSAADTGNTFRYDPGSGQYIFNLSTKSTMTAPWATGTYQLIIDLGDGVLHAVSISLK